MLDNDDNLQLPDGSPVQPSEPEPLISPDSPEPPDPTESASLSFGPSDDEIAEQLREYHEAIKQEFMMTEAANGEGLLEPSRNVEKYTRDFFKRNVADAAAQVVWLSCNSSSDSIRLNACKFIIGTAMADAADAGDPIRDLLNGLSIKEAASN